MVKKNKNRLTKQEEIDIMASLKEQGLELTPAGKRSLKKARKK